MKTLLQKPLSIARLQVARWTLLLCLMSFLASTSRATIYYVAKTGSDANEGTNLAAPFLTIQKAASLMGAGDSCYVRAGIYRETVTPSHSGTGAAPIFFAPYSNEDVVVSGADLLNLTWQDYSNSIYSATTTNSFNQLFVDGDMMNEARWPNAQVDRLLAAPRASVGSAGTSNLYLTDTNLPNVSLVGATVHMTAGTPGGEYFAYARTIATFNPATGQITWTNSFDTSQRLQAGNPYYIFGALSLLDIPTEWYLDSTAGTLYLWTPDGASPSTHQIEIKDRASAFTLDGRTNIILSGFYIFAAGITMSNASSCVVDDCHLRYVMHQITANGAQDKFNAACNIGPGNTNIWQNSTIMFSSQGGLDMPYFSPGALVTNCVIRDIDYFPGNYYAAIRNTAANSRIVGNTLTNSGRFLIQLGQGPVEVGFNDLGGGEQLTRDGGALYTGQTDGKGTTIHNNWARYSDVGIYLDNSSTNFLVYRNVCHDNRSVGMILNSPSINNGAYNNTLMRNTSSLTTAGAAGRNQAGTSIINLLADSVLLLATNATTNSIGWFPPVGPDFVPETGSGAIDTGTVVSPYTDGYVGAGPDIGAYEAGATYWTPGASIEVPPFPTPESTSSPSVPTGLIASADTNAQQVDLAWTASTGLVSYYNLLRSTTSGGPYTNIAIVISGSSFIDASAVIGTTYYYVVSAVNSSGTSGTSAEAGAMPVISPFYEAEGAVLSGSYVGNYWAGYQGWGYDTWSNSTGNSITWNVNTGNAATYVLNFRYANGSGANRPLQLIVNGTTNANQNFPATSAWNGWSTVTNKVSLTAGTNVIQLATIGYSGGSIDYLRLTYLSPPFPNGLTATPVSSSQINLAWSASAGAASYNVKRATMSGGPYTSIATGVTEPSYSDTGLAAGTAYYYVISAVNGGESTNSAEAGATTLGVPGPWLSQDIGAVGVPGTANYNSGTFTLVGSGADITTTNDEFQYVYQLASGSNCQITARVVAEPYITAYTKVGVMIRETLAANSKYAAMLLTPTNVSFSNGLIFQYRPTTGGTTTTPHTTGGLAAPYWTQVARTNNTFTAYGSPDGVTWTSWGSVTLSMSTNFYVGLVDCSHNNSLLCTSMVSNVTAP